MSESAAEGGCEKVGEMESDYRREQWLLLIVDLRGTEYLVDVERRYSKGFSSLITLQLRGPVVSYFPAKARVCYVRPCRANIFSR